MYHYDEFDRQIVSERVAQFRDQVARRLRGALTEDEFAPLRLQNGLYKQLHAYMLRVAIPYGTLSSRQMLKLADIADQFDRGYGHFTTRQNIQFNWLELEQVPDILESLAQADMHAIQTSGNCIRNITCDPFAGVAADEILDPRPLAELLRQWSTLHPEFLHLPRKFKIAITAAQADRAAVFFHDIGLRVVKNPAGKIGYEVIVGGGQGRTPIIGQVLNPFVAFNELLPYLESIMRVYNLYGRRDNKYKARIKILVGSLGLERFRKEVEDNFALVDHSTFALASSELQRIEAMFVAVPSALNPITRRHKNVDGAKQPTKAWLKHNVHAHKAAGYAVVTITLKTPGRAPGDASADEMRLLARLASKYSNDELRITHEQNIVLPYVRRGELATLWRQLDEAGLAYANHGMITDIIACPGLDYCSLASASSIPLAKLIADKFLAAEQDIGPLSIKISGCVNACGHHHAGHIGILGVEKGGREYYQMTLGGSATESPAIGQRLGPAIEANEVVTTIEALLAHYREVRTPGETFIDSINRLGSAAFREALNATDS
jgi:sulfite reductase (NADPH) hemoprotein beta-component